MTTKVFQSSARPRYSAWGYVDDAEQVAPGIWRVHTPSHGGYVISAERKESMPKALREYRTFVQDRSDPASTGCQYEEDCDWCIVVLAFWDEMSARYPDPVDQRRYLEQAVGTAIGWIKDAWVHEYVRAHYPDFCKVPA